MKVLSGLKVYWPLLPILAVAIWLRMWQAEVSPPGFTTEEAGLAYEAMNGLVWQSPSVTYSGILKTLSLMTSLNVPTIRSVSLTSGVLSVLLISKLGKQVFGSSTVGLAAALLLAVNPWHIQLSRAAFPQTLAIFLGVMALVCLLSRGKWRWTSSLWGVAAMMTHPAATLVVPILLGSILVSRLKNKDEKSTAIVASIVLLLSTSIAVVAYKNQLIDFYWRSAFFNELGFVNHINKTRGYFVEAGLAPLAPFMANKVSAFILEAGRRYLAPWDWYWLFSNSRYEPGLLLRDFGTFHFAELPLFAWGLVQLIKVSKFSKKVPLNRTLYVWLLISSLPGILLLLPNLLTTFYWVLPIWILTTAYGFVKVWQVITVRYLEYGYGLLVSVFFLTGCLTFITMYTQILPWQAAKQWEYGYAELAKILSNELSTTKHLELRITDRLGGAPLIQLTIHQPTVNWRADNFTYQSINSWDTVPKGPGSVIVAVPGEVPKNFVSGCISDPNKHCPTWIKTISYPSGQMAAYVLYWNPALLIEDSVPLLLQGG